MIFILLTMFNFLVQKTKCVIEKKTDVNKVSIGKTNVSRRVINFEGDDTQLKETIYDIIKTIKDPEKPATLEELNVVQEEDIYVTRIGNSKLVKVVFTPTVPHCSLATLIGLCIRMKLQRMLSEQVKIDIFVKEGTHSTEQEINKQVNDKERVAAAMENPNLIKIVETCIQDDEL